MINALILLIIVPEIPKWSLTQGGLRATFSFSGNFKLIHYRFPPRPDPGEIGASLWT